LGTIKRQPNLKRRNLKRQKQAEGGANGGTCGGGETTILNISNQEGDGKSLKADYVLDEWVTGNVSEGGGTEGS